MKGERPGAAEQSISSYNGFNAGLDMEQGKSKSYFRMSYSQPPNKSVVKDIMDGSGTTAALSVRQEP